MENIVKKEMRYTWYIGTFAIEVREPENVLLKDSSQQIDVVKIEFRLKERTAEKIRRLSLNGENICITMTKNIKNQRWTRNIRTISVTEVMQYDKSV